MNLKVFLPDLLRDFRLFGSGGCPPQRRGPQGGFTAEVVSPPARRPTLRPGGETTSAGGTITRPYRCRPARPSPIRPPTIPRKASAPEATPYLGSFPGFGSSIGNEVAPVVGAGACIVAGASLCAPLAGGVTGADAVVVVFAAVTPLPEFTAVMNRRAESSLRVNLPGDNVRRQHIRLPVERLIRVVIDRQSCPIE